MCPLRIVPSSIFNDNFFAAALAGSEEARLRCPSEGCSEAYLGVWCIYLASDKEGSRGRSVDGL